MRSIDQAKQPIVIVAGIFVVATLALTIILATKQQNYPIPSSIENQVKFPILLPSPLPSGVKYNLKSFAYSGGIFNYLLNSSYGSITIAEQSAPANPPDLSGLSGFTSSNVPAGTAYIGSSSGRPVAIITSNTTLLTMDANKTVPDDTLSQLSKVMAIAPK